MSDELDFCGARLATQSDEDEIFGLLMLLHAENAMFSMNRDKVRAFIKTATERKGAIIGVIERDGRIVASVGMIINTYWYSDDCYLHELYNFVHPEYRRGKDGFAKKLIQFSKNCSDWFGQKGTPMPLQMGIVSNHQTEAKVRLYRRHMPYIGAFFMYGAETHKSNGAAH